MSDQKAEFDTPPEEPLDPTLQPGPEGGEGPAQQPEGEAPAQAEKPREDPRVPLAALQEARREARETKQRLAEVERIAGERLAHFERQLQQFSTPKPAPEPEIVIPDPNDDFAGWIKGTIAQEARERKAMAQRLQQYEEHRQQTEQQSVEMQQEQRLVDMYAADAQKFASNTPDWGAVYNGWVQTKLGQWMKAGYSLEQAKNNLKMEERAFVVGALNSGISPAETVYDIAKSYVQHAQAQAAPAEAPRAPNGQFVAQKAVTPAPRSLSQARGAPGGQNSPSDILALSNEEFLSRYGDNSAWKKLMTGQA